MRVAFASQNLAVIDAHFGWARHVMIYDVSAEGYRHIQTIPFTGSLQPDGDEAKLTAKLEAVRACALVFVSDIGVAAEARLAQRDIRPLRSFAGQPISTALDNLTMALRNDPVHWLRRQEQLSRQAGD